MPSIFILTMDESSRLTVKLTVNLLAYCESCRDLRDSIEAFRMAKESLKPPVASKINVTEVGIRCLKTDVTEDKER